MFIYLFMFGVAVTYGPVTYICISIYVYIYVSLSLYIYAYTALTFAAPGPNTRSRTHTHTHTNRHSDTQTHRHTHTHMRALAQHPMAGLILWFIHTLYIRLTRYVALTALCAVNAAWQSSLYINKKSGEKEALKQIKINQKSINR